MLSKIKRNPRPDHLSYTLKWDLATAFTILVLILAPISQAQARYAALIMEADSGRVLYEINADTRNFPASLTKMMTLYLVFEALEEGRLKGDQSLMVSRRAVRMPASKLGLKRGQSIRVEDAILALVTKSANDVAVVVAEALAGTEAEFARVMTRKAKALGMTNTNFRNASGLYNRSQLSTARDMAILAQALIRDFPGRYKTFATRSFSYNGRKYRNHNKLLRNYKGTDGLKTGYIAASGYNLAASVKRDGHRVIAVVFGGKTARSRDRHVAKLLDRGFRRLNDPIYLATGGALIHSIAPPPTAETAPASAPPAMYEVALHLASFRSKEGARRGWARLQQQLPDLLAGMSPRFPVVDLGEEGIYYRVVTDPFPNRATAADLCAMMTAAGQECRVIQSAPQQVVESAPSTKVSVKPASPAPAAAPAEPAGTENPPTPVFGEPLAPSPVKLVMTHGEQAVPPLLQLAEVEKSASSPQLETPPAKKAGLVPPPTPAPAAEPPEPLLEVEPSADAELSMLPPEEVDTTPEETDEPAPSEVPQVAATLTPALATEQGAAALEGTPAPAPSAESPDPAPQTPAPAATSSEWSRLAGPPAYPSPNMPDARLSQSDLARAIGAIGDLGFFFSKLADTDPNPLARQVWRSAGQAYTAGEGALEAALQQGRLWLSDEAPDLAVQRRGDTFVVAARLADDWAAPATEESEGREDGWSTAASLASHLIGAWVEGDPARSAAWFERHVTAAGFGGSASATEDRPPRADLARYWVFKDVFLRASLLRASTEAPGQQGLWSTRESQIKTRLSVFLDRLAVDAGPDWTTRLRSDWTAYRADTARLASERTWLLLAKRRSGWGSS